MNARVGVGREARVVFARHSHQPDRAVLEHLVQAEHVVAGDAEDVLDAQRTQAVDQVLPDRHHGARRFRAGLRRAVSSGFQRRGAAHDSPPCWFRVGLSLGRVRTFRPDAPSF